MKPFETISPFTTNAKITVSKNQDDAIANPIGAR